MEENPKTGIQQALDLFDGSPTKLANAIGNNILRQNIEQWIKAGVVPASKAPFVEAATGIRCELLCPDVAWAVLRKAPKKAKAVA